MGGYSPTSRRLINFGTCNSFANVDFFCSLPFSPLLAYRVPCRRLIVFSSFSSRFSLGGAAGLQGTFTGHPRPPSPFSFLDDTIRTQHDIHGWPIRPGFQPWYREPCRSRGGGRKSVFLPSITLPSNKFYFTLQMVKNLTSQFLKSMILVVI
jgi:hypothetical protein